jgi:hypothetical protein
MARTALITGASAGLGVEFARQLAARGFDLLLVARREERLAEVARELQQGGEVSVHTHAADLSDPAAPAAIEAFVRAQSLEVACLINNAGSAGPHLIDPEASDWAPHARYLELMMLSVAQMCHRFIPPMRERGFGRVLNISSFAGRIASAEGGNYGPSKAYVISLSEELALMLRGTGVQVCALCPGFVHTEFHEVGGLMDMKQRTPGLLWYDAQTVVREGLEAVERGRSVMISGRLYRWLDPLARSSLARRLGSLRPRTR